MLRPIIAIVGRPNVGKSTLFNRLIGRRRSLVRDVPGVTRDRLYGTVVFERWQATVVDTGGFDPGSESDLVQGVRRQVLQAVDEADLLVFVVDGRAGITGLVNPGYDQATIQNVVLTIPKPTDWNFKFEVDLKDKSGKTTHYIADGKLDQIGYDQRTLKGTWSAGTAKGDFKLTRDRDYTR